METVCGAAVGCSSDVWRYGDGVWGGSEVYIWRLTLWRRCVGRQWGEHLTTDAMETVCGATVRCTSDDWRYGDGVWGDSEVYIWRLTLWRRCVGRQWGEHLTTDAMETVCGAAVRCTSDDWRYGDGVWGGSGVSIWRLTLWRRCVGRQWGEHLTTDAMETVCGATVRCTSDDWRYGDGVWGGSGVSIWRLTLWRRCVGRQWGEHLTTDAMETVCGATVRCTSDDWRYGDGVWGGSGVSIWRLTLWRRCVGWQWGVHLASGAL